MGRRRRGGGAAAEEEVSTLSRQGRELGRAWLPADRLGQGQDRQKIATEQTGIRVDGASLCARAIASLQFSTDHPCGRAFGWHRVLHYTRTRRAAQGRHIRSSTSSLGCLGDVGQGFAST